MTDTIAYADYNDDTPERAHVADLNEWEAAHYDIADVHPRTVCACPDPADLIDQARAESERLLAAGIHDAIWTEDGDL